jgi:hypothetical protein
MRKWAGALLCGWVLWVSYNTRDHGIQNAGETKAACLRAKTEYIDLDIKKGGKRHGASTVYRVRPEVSRLMEATMVTYPERELGGQTPVLCHSVGPRPTAGK